MRNNTYLTSPAAARRINEVDEDTLLEEFRIGIDLDDDDLDEAGFDRSATRAARFEEGTRNALAKALDARRVGDHVRYQTAADPDLATMGRRFATAASLNENGSVDYLVGTYLALALVAGSFEEAEAVALDYSGKTFEEAAKNLAYVARLAYEQG